MLDQQIYLCWEPEEENRSSNADKQDNLKTIASIPNEHHINNKTDKTGQPRACTIGEEQCGDHHEDFYHMKNFCPERGAFDKKSEWHKDHHRKKGTSKVWLYKKGAHTTKPCASRDSQLIISCECKKGGCIRRS